MVGEVGALVGVAGNRRQLVRVAEQHDLHAAERLVGSLPGLPQAAVDRVEQVGVDHGDLIDDQGVDGVEQLAQLGRPARSSWSAMTPIGSRNSEWIVCPPTFSAATPVGAQITTCFEVFQDRWFSSVDLPVPARPVTKMCSRVPSIVSYTAACSAESWN